MDKSHGQINGQIKLGPNKMDKTNWGPKVKTKKVLTSILLNNNSAQGYRNSLQ